ncbi:OsmC family protein [Vitreoscilla massiliensis]|uniref:OsmC family protein n=1 Tax=Vitreoscilla massiliensis TaxID=1689272 RepID=A0ABY4E0V0_9NEIS|nr:OsmC family protein [Vitreoscilla massiliensis]UOO89422.1 OsmC family protein [Vitreoscilla massiliensis]
MSLYAARVVWLRQPQEAFTDNAYSRLHQWQFDEGVSVPASSSVHSVPLPHSVSAAVDPEEALVAAVSSCHMLWFLGICAKKDIVVESYDDQAEGIMAKNAANRDAITQIFLRPDIVFGGAQQPDAVTVTKIHALAHHSCYIANSILATVTVEAPLR